MSRASDAEAPAIELRVCCVSVSSAPDCPEVGLALGVAAALLAPAISIAVGISPAWLPGIGSVWRAAHLTSATGMDPGLLSGVLLTQAIVVIAVFVTWRMIGALAPQSGWFLPEWRVSNHARTLLRNDGANILIYVAHAQRTVRVMASPRSEALLAPGTLAAVRDALLIGLVAGDEDAAFEAAGAVLKRACRD